MIIDGEPSMVSVTLNFDAMTLKMQPFLLRIILIVQVFVQIPSADQDLSSSHGFHGRHSVTLTVDL